MGDTEGAPSRIVGRKKKTHRLTGRGRLVAGIAAWEQRRLGHQDALDELFSGDASSSPSDNESDQSSTGPNSSPVLKAGVGRAELPGNRPHDRPGRVAGNKPTNNTLPLPTKTQIRVAALSEEQQLPAWQREAPPRPSSSDEICRSLDGYLQQRLMGSRISKLQQGQAVRYAEAWFKTRAPGVPEEQRAQITAVSVVHQTRRQHYHDAIERRFAGEGEFLRQRAVRSDVAGEIEDLNLLVDGYRLETPNPVVLAMGRLLPYACILLALLSWAISSALVVAAAGVLPVVVFAPLAAYIYYEFTAWGYAKSRELTCSARQVMPDK